MARLTSLPSRLSLAPPRLALPTRQEASRDRDRQRLEDQSWRRWYGTARWKALRWEVLTRDRFTCQMCAKLEADTSQLVCDHIDPHKGDEAKFWAGPFQTLCKPCHDGAKQSLDKSGIRAAGKPKWLRPSRIPLTIVCGPPAAGKNTYIAARAEPRDTIIDLDAIVADLSRGPTHGWDRDRWLNPALFKRNAMLADLSRDTTHDRAWFIVGEPEARGRQWWADTLKPEEIVVLETSEGQCIANAARDPDRPRKSTADGIVNWWFRYQPRRGDTRIRPPGG